MEAGEAGSEIAAPEEGADGGDGIGAQWSHGAAVVLFVAGDEIVPGVVDELTEGRGARAARVMDDGHECPSERNKSWAVQVGLRDTIEGGEKQPIAAWRAFAVCPGIDRLW